MMDGWTDIVEWMGTDIDGWMDIDRYGYGYDTTEKTIF
jgi:hypothetical protein